MNTKRLLYGLFVTLCLIVASCTTDTSDNALYEVGVKRKDVSTTNKQSVKRKYVQTSNKQSVKRKDVSTSNKVSSN